MDIYLYSKTPDLTLAATTLADLQAMIAALADPSTAANAATLARVQGALQQMVQNDTGEPLRISSYDDASTLSSWITDTGTSLAVGLGDSDPAAINTYASTDAFTIASPYRTGNLALNTAQLANRLRIFAPFSSISTGSRAGGWLTLQVRKTTAGVTQTVGMIPLQVFAGVLSTTPQTLQPDSYLTLAQAQATFQPLDADLTSWALITRAAGFDTFTTTPTGANLASLLTTALPASKGGTGLTALAANVVTLLGAADYSAFRTSLGVAIGSDVQAYAANLTSWAAVAPASYSTTAQIAAAYQPLDSDLTSWAAITRASGFDTFSATPSSANLLALLTTKTGTGNAVFATSPTLTTPTLGVALATSINGNTFTTGTYTLTGTAAKTLTFTNTLTLTGTDSTVMTFPTTTATIARTDAGQTFTGTQAFATVTVSSTINGVKVWQGLGADASSLGVGTNALNATTTGNRNTAVGRDAGLLIQGGVRNTMLGCFAGNSLVSGDRNVMFGYNAGAYATGSDELYIDNQDRTNTAGDKAGAILYGTFSSTPGNQTLVANAKLTVSNTTVSTSTITGSIIAAGGLGALGAGWFGGVVSAALGFQVGATAGIDTTITTASLVGKTITVTKGIITGFA